MITIRLVQTWLWHESENSLCLMAHIKWAKNKQLKWNTRKQYTQYQDTMFNMITFVENRTSYRKMFNVLTQIHPSIWSNVRVRQFAILFFLLECLCVCVYFFLGLNCDVLSVLIETFSFFIIFGHIKRNWLVCVFYFKS